MTIRLDPVTSLQRASDPVRAVLEMCERGHAALLQAVSITEATDVLAAVSILEHAVKVRDLNQEAVVAASTLRIRAERRIGELLIAANIGAGRPRKIVDGNDNYSQQLPPQITRDESSKFQRLAAVPESAFEQAIERVAEDAKHRSVQVTREAVMRTVHPVETPYDHWKDADRFKSACDRLCELHVDATEAIRWGHFPSADSAEVQKTAMLLSLQKASEAIEDVRRMLTARRKKHG